MGECKAGDECFVNTVTGQKFYDLPHTKAAAEELVLPAGWSLTTSNSTGVTYYVKPVRGARGCRRASLPAAALKLKPPCGGGCSGR